MLAAGLFQYVERLESSPRKHALLSQLVVQLQRRRCRMVDRFLVVSGRLIQLPTLCRDVTQHFKGPRILGIFQELFTKRFLRGRQILHGHCSRSRLNAVDPARGLRLRS